jgi:hypothetical protein
MLFFFPDSQDQIDPRFDFVAEKHSTYHVRQRDDLYAHEAHDEPPYHGILVSKAMVDGNGGAGRYTSAQRNRLLGMGARRFFRLDRLPGPPLLTLGDCGAFSYHLLPEPPYSVDEVLEFYETCGFDLGVSVDHVILGYRPELDREGGMPEDWLCRQELTLRLAERFLERRERTGANVEPIGVAQGWSPRSYRLAVRELQAQGYRRIALGGMVPLRTEQIIDCLEECAEERRPDVQFHLLGVLRHEHVVAFAGFGVTSFDSTSPFRQAFKDDRDNFHTLRGEYSALRIPPVDGNAKIAARVQAGELDQGDARRLERACMTALIAYDRGDGTLTDAHTALREFTAFCRLQKRTARMAVVHDDLARRTLEDRPWAHCPCAICRNAGVQVAIFRGTERNKRRGMHNLWVFARRLERALGETSEPARTTQRA